MPRSNHPRGKRASDNDDDFDLSRFLNGRLTTEHKRSGLFAVQPVSAASAQKTYLCPGCGRDILPGTAHTVIWRADGIMGEEDDLANRRHWHLHCWKIAP
jgi:hypothetical protein